jgi:hypothetical protein
MNIKNLIETPIQDILSSNKKIIKFDYDFNENIDFLENSQIEEIYFESSGIFNQNLNKLPLSLKIIKIPRNFNHKIDFFPPNLEILIIFSNYNYELNNLPEGLLELYLFNTTNYNLDNIPNSIKILVCGNRDIKINFLPYSLEKLVLTRYHLYKIEVFPPNLKKVHLSYYYNFDISNLPNGLTHLTIAGGPREYQEDENNLCKFPEFDQDINNLPDTIETIEICLTKYDNKITKLPKNLESIIFYVICHVDTPNIEEIKNEDIDFFCRCMKCKLF